MALKASAIEKVYGDKFIGGNRVTVFHKGKAAFTDIFDEIAQAKKTVCLIFYIFRDDSTGRDLARLLKKKVREGLNVCVLYDHFGSFMTRRRFWNDLKTAGVAVRASRPFKWHTPSDYIHRDHRKLIVIDGGTAFTGGLNIADEYRGYVLLRRRVKGWRDTAVKIRGPAARKLHGIFNKTWRFWKGKPVDIAPVNDTTYDKDETGGLKVMPIFSSSSKGRRKMRRLLHWCIRKSHNTIDLTTAYFTPSRRMLHILSEAVKRGVRVRLLLPLKSDIAAARYAGTAFFSRLLKSGVEIYLYQEAVLHAKAYIFDTIFSIVGSANLDFQSLRKNDEGNVGVYDEGFGSRMTRIFENDIRESRKLDLEEWMKRPFCDKIKEKFFVLFRRRL